MPYLTRAGEPSLYYELDDYTDPWKQAPYLLLQHGYARSPSRIQRLRLGDKLGGKDVHAIPAPGEGP